jgi:predicted ribosome quality control (RQC) complex YloA/Tae2 family protein
VKKPSGAKPGFVIYENQQTIYVTPDEDLVIRMKKQ